MTADESTKTRSARSWITRQLVRLGKALRHILLALLILWASLAVFYSNLPWGAARVILSIAFIAFAVHAVWIAPRKTW